MTTRGTVPAGSARAADRRARRMSPQQRRDHLIATALQLYSRRHPEDVSIDDIVAAADVSRALFYRYFTNLREVHLAALGRVVDDLIAELALPAAGQLRERLRTALSRFVAFAESYAGSYAALLRSGSTVADRNTDSLVERVRDHVVALFGGLLGAAPAPMLERTLRGWMSVVDTTLIGWLDERDLPREQLEAWLVDQLVGMLRTTAEHDPATAEQLALLGG